MQNLCNCVFFLSIVKITIGIKLHLILNFAKLISLKALPAGFKLQHLGSKRIVHTTAFSREGYGRDALFQMSIFLQKSVEFLHAVLKKSQ